MKKEPRLNISQVYCDLSGRTRGGKNNDAHKQRLPLLCISSLDTAVSDAAVAAASEAAAGLPGWWPADPTSAGWCGDGAPPCTDGPPADGGGGGGGVAYHGQPVCPLNMRSLSYTDSAVPPLLTPLPPPPPLPKPPPPPGW